MSAPIRVLLADHDEAILAAAVPQLRAGGAFAVDTACCEEEVWERLAAAETAYDVALIAETLPPRRAEEATRSGLEVMRHLKTLSPCTESLLLTAAGSINGLQALREGACHYFEKPLQEMEEVALRIRRVAEMGELRRAGETGGANAPPAAPETGAAAQTREPRQEGEPKGLLAIHKALRRATIAMATSRDRIAPLETIIEYAVSALGAKTGGLYRYYPERGELTLIAGSRQELHTGRVLEAGEGMSGRLVRGERPYMVVSDYDHWPHRASIYAEDSGFGAVLGVPVQWQGRVIGCLYVNDDTGRSFTREEVGFLTLIAAQAAIALINLIEGDEKLEHLGKLSQATRRIMDDLAGTELDDRLELIARHATEILNAESCGVFRVEREGFLTLRASYGHQPGKANIGRELEIHHRPGGGLTGWIAGEGKVFNLHGEKLKTHLAVSGHEEYHTESEDCHSLVAVPLKRRRSPSDPEERVVGLLRVDNKKDLTGGPPQSELAFTKEDERILGIFAEEVVVALEAAELVRKLMDLMRASNIVVEAEELEEGLQQLAQMMVRLLPHTFCRILLMDEDGASLEVQAADCSPAAGGPARWDGSLGERLRLADWHGLQEVLEEGVPRLLRRTDRRDCVTLDRITGLLGLDRPLQSLLLVPSMAQGRVVGLLEVGELGSESRYPFTAREQELAAAIAAHTAVLIDRRRMHQITRRQKEGLELLQRAIESIAQEREPSRVTSVVAENAALTLGADCALVWAYDAEQGTFIEGGIAGSRLPSQVLQAFREEEGKRGRSGPAAIQRSWIAVPDLTARKVPYLHAMTRDLLRREGARRLLGIALLAGNEPVGALFLGYRSSGEIAAEDRWRVERLGSYAAVSLKRARLLEQVTRANRLAQVVSDVMTLGVPRPRLGRGGELMQPASPEGVEEILRLVPTNTLIGLGCDVVTLFVFDPVTGRLALPPHHTPLSNPDSILGKGKADDSPLIRKLVHKRSPEPLIVEDVPNHKLTRESVFARLEAILSFAAVPLQAAGERVGVLFVNYRSRHHFTQAEQESIRLFANHAAIAIRNAQLYHQARRKQETLNALYEASRAINTSLSLEETLQQVAQQARRIAAGNAPGRCQAYVTLAEAGKLTVITASTPELVEVLRARIGQHDLQVGCGGIVDRAIHRGQTLNVPDVRADPDYVEVVPWTRSQLSIPLSDRGKVIGALSIEHEAKAAFSDEDQENFESLATQAAAAIQSAQRLEELEALHRAAFAMSEAVQLGSVRQSIVAQAREMFTATSVVLWPYDAHREQFLLESLAASGLPEEELARIKGKQPRTNHFRQTLLREGSLEISEVAHERPPYLGTAAHQFLRRNGIGSVQAIALRVGEEPVGALFVNYHQPQRFGERQHRQLANFASYASLALKKARLTDQVERANLITEILAQVSAVGEREGPLRALLTMAPVALGCDVVRLYLCHPRSGAFSVFSLHGQGATHRLVEEPVEELGLLRRILRRESLFIQDRSQRRRAPVRWPVTEDRKLPSWAALRMIAAHQPVGVFFIGYRRPQHFMDEELSSMGLLANQAAVAIANNQLYEQSQQRADRFNALYSAGRGITQSLGLPETLGEIADQALQIAGTEPEGSFAYVVLVNQQRCEVAAASPPQRYPVLADTIQDLHLDEGEGKIGIVGRAFKQGKPILCRDVREHPDYIPLDTGVRSQIAVPVRFERRRIGVISVEKPVAGAFSPEDVRYIELLAAQAAAAIENARRYSELRETKGLVGTRTVLAWTNLMASAWRHDIETDAVTIRNEASLLARGLRELPRGHSLLKKVEKIHRLADRIRKRPIAPPLGSEAGRSSLRINEMVTDWVNRLWHNDLYTGIRKQIDSGLDPQATTHASAEWLRRAFDYLMQNAAQAVAANRTRRIKVSTWQEGAMAHIDVWDNGPGIPPRIQKKLFREPIRKPGHRVGLGVGLLLAQVIAQAYEGDVSCADPGPRGTIMRLSLRLE